MVRLSLFITLSTTLFFSSIATADTVVEGATDGGALIKIQVPDVWNGGLVIYNHGFDLGAIVPSTPDLGPLATLMLSEGYAVAASSYQQNGWALYKTKNDLQNLVGVFKANFGTPTEVYVHGFSLGGAVTAQALEKANLGNAQFGGALQACFGLFAPPAFRTPGQTSRLALFLDEVDLPESFVVTDMGFAVFALSDLIFDPAKLDGAQGIGNIGVAYENAGIDAAVERVAAHPGGANRHAKNFTPKGNVGDVKIVSNHTSGDGLVIVEQQEPYQSSVDAGNLTVAVVNEAGNTHCGFTGGELVAGWEALRGWVATDVQPSVVDIQGTCLAVQGAFGGPCRYDPGFVIPSMDIRIAPR